VGKDKEEEVVTRNPGTLVVMAAAMVVVAQVLRETFEQDTEAALGPLHLHPQLQPTQMVYRNSSLPDLMR